MQLQTAEKSLQTITNDSESSPQADLSYLKN